MYLFLMVNNHKNENKQKTKQRNNTKPQTENIN